MRDAAVLRPHHRRNGGDLAQRLARVAHALRESVAGALDSQETAHSALSGLLAAYREAVDATAATTQFADTLAQVAVYALFVARCQRSDRTPFSRREVARLPAAHPFLRALFDAIGHRACEAEPFGPALDAAERLLAEAELTLSSKTVPDAAPGDPAIACYEAFLRAYDPALRGRRGVYLTPEPVVSYLVRSVDALLAADFGLAGGLAPIGPNPRVTVEDPACGTGAFLAAVLAHVRGRLERTGKANSWTEGPRALLPRLHGRELLPAPYLIAHLIVGIQLAALDLPGDEHIHITLGNALEDLGTDEAGSGRLASNTLPGPVHEGWLEAGATRRRLLGSSNGRNILVMLGNPPYAGHSANGGAAIARLLHGLDPDDPDHPDDPDGAPSGSYFAVDGIPLAEHNLKWLNDDYVKFVRYAQWRIERAGQGILAFVTSSGYLESPTFRGMRRSLMHSFDALYLLDLGGSARLNRRAADTEPSHRVIPARRSIARQERARQTWPLHVGATSTSRDVASERTTTRDENVFAIQQGVALALFVRRLAAPDSTREATVHHAQLRGEREEKLRWLAEHSVVDTPWHLARPQAPFFSFVPREGGRDAEYARGWPLPELMPAHSLGILTKRDALVVGFAPHELLARIQAFADPALSDADCAARFNLPPRDRDRWNLAHARRELACTVDPALLRPLAYRPLDARVVYYDPRLVARPNVRVMRHLRPERANVALVVGRQGAATGSACWDAAFVTATLADQNLFRRGGGTVFPLYLCPDAAGEHTGPDGAERQVNLHPAFVAQLSAGLGLTWLADGRGDLTSTFGPEDVAAYVYALLFAPSYRARYAEALRTDFPRIPLSGDRALFRALCRLGQRLLALHLLERVPAALPRVVGRGTHRGTNRVERVRYTPSGGEGEQGCAWINATQRIVGIAPPVWTFSIGGYRVAQKWLADRRGRILTDEELRHYRQVLAVLGETRALMRQIDAAIATHGGWPLRAQ